jgi:class 3 adenylate cyclase
MTTPHRPYAEERRLATVLFADIQGFTPLADRLDFEEVSDLIQEVWLQVDRVIETYGGYIDKHIGDAVMAVWGAPHAREDDAERAVTAALALQASLADYAARSDREGARNLQMRVGLNTGPVLSGYVGLREEYTVMGDTVNVASRLEHLADPGTVLMSESTYRLVRGAFHVHRLPPVQVRGKPEPVSLYVVDSASNQPSRVRYRSAGGLETRMVARELELAHLFELYQQARGAWTPILAVVRGDPGLGKSRLLLEFTGQLEVDEPVFTLLATRGLAQASRVPFFVWKSLWHDRFGLRESDPPEAAREKFARGVQSLWGDTPGPTSAAEAAHLIGGLTGLEWPDSPYLAALQDNSTARVKKSFELTREILCRACASGPTMLLLDDLHWADAGSLDLLSFLLTPGPAPLPLLILGGARPGFLRHNSWLANAAEVIVLKPLPVSAAVVASAYPSLRHLPEETRAELAERAEGNPYFLEEMVKSLHPSESATSLAALLPESLQTLLQARLDTLSPEARSVALLASVVGRVFWAGAVRAAMHESLSTGFLKLPSVEPDTVVTNGLAELMRAELAFPRAGSVFANEREFIFKHSLLRDVAYSLLPRKQLRLYHMAVARWLAASTGQDSTAMVAEHLEVAGAFSEATQQYERAARYAASRGAVREAAWLETRARELAGKSPAAGSGLLQEPGRPAA